MFIEGGINRSIIAAAVNQALPVFASPFPPPQPPNSMTAAIARIIADRNPRFALLLFVPHALLIVFLPIFPITSLIIFMLAIHSFHPELCRLFILNCTALTFDYHTDSEKLVFSPLERLRRPHLSNPHRHTLILSVYACFHPFFPWLARHSVAFLWNIRP